MRLLLTVSLLIHCSHVYSFYVPGIAPTEFAKGSRIGEDIVMMLALKGWRKIHQFNFSFLQR